MRLFWNVKPAKQMGMQVFIGVVINESGTELARCQGFCPRMTERNIIQRAKELHERIKKVN